MLIRLYSSLLAVILASCTFVGYFFAFLAGSSAIAGLTTVALIFSFLLRKPNPSPAVVVVASMFTVAMAVVLHH